MSRQKIAQAIQNVEKRGMVGQALQTFVTQNLSDAEQRFVNVYLQAVGRISGLSQIVRSGRPTEATIERLKSELPNPAYAGSAAAARDKLALLHDEINIAMDKGQFSEQPLAGKKTGEMTDDEFLQKF
jgi:DNA-binding phage protein